MTPPKKGDLVHGRFAGFLGIVIDTQPASPSEGRPHDMVLVLWPLNSSNVPPSERWLRSDACGVVSESQGDP